MLEKSWIIWLILFVASLVLEAVSMQLFSVWFAAGALVTVIVSLFDVPVWVQVVVFVSVTAISLIATRPLVRKLQKHEKTPTNADRYTGQTAIVLEEIDNIKGTGQIKVSGQIWSARTADATVIPVGASVQTVSYQSTKMFVTLAPVQAAHNEN